MSIIAIILAIVLFLFASRRPDLRAVLFGIGGLCIAFAVVWRLRNRLQPGTCGSSAAFLPRSPPMA